MNQSYHCIHAARGWHSLQPILSCLCSLVKYDIKVHYLSAAHISRNIPPVLFQLCIYFRVFRVAVNHREWALQQFEGYNSILCRPYVKLSRSHPNPNVSILYPFLWC